MNNKYINRSKISEAKFREIIRYFSLDLDALQIAENTINMYLKLVRQKLAEYCASNSPFIDNVKLDESYFGARRIRGKRGRWILMVKLSYLVKRCGKVYTELAPDCKSKTLQDIISGKISAESIIHTDGWRDYDGLVDIGYDKHFMLIIVIMSLSINKLILTA